MSLTIPKLEQLLIIFIIVQLTYKFSHKLTVLSVNSQHEAGPFLVNRSEIESLQEEARLLDYTFFVLQIKPDYYKLQSHQDEKDVLKIAKKLMQSGYSYPLFAKTESDKIHVDQEITRDRDLLLHLLVENSTVLNQSQTAPWLDYPRLSRCDTFFTHGDYSVPKEIDDAVRKGSYSHSMWYESSRSLYKTDLAFGSNNFSSLRDIDPTAKVAIGRVEALQRYWLSAGKSNLIIYAPPMTGKGLFMTMINHQGKGLHDTNDVESWHQITPSLVITDLSSLVMKSMRCVAVLPDYSTFLKRVTAMEHTDVYAWYNYINRNVQRLPHCEVIYTNRLIGELVNCCSILDLLYYAHWQQ